jgi:hypothetical protein
MIKPLFIPLKRKFFEQFNKGTKNTEYRAYGPRWNYGTCELWRSVVLSLGYGKQKRLRGIITKFRALPVYELSLEDQKAFRECYPNAQLVAYIQIQIVRGNLDSTQ